MSPTTLKPLANQFQPGHNASPTTASRELRRNLNTCSNLASSAPHPVPGHLLSTWFPRRPPATGVCVVIIVPSIEAQYLTGTLSHTSMVSHTWTSLVTILTNMASPPYQKKSRPSVITHNPSHKVNSVASLDL